MKGGGQGGVGDTWGGWGTFGRVEGCPGRGTRGILGVGNGHTFGFGGAGGWSMPRLVLLTPEDCDIRKERSP